MTSAEVANLQTRMDGFEEQLDEVKSDVKEIRRDITDLKVTIARWAGIIIGGLTIAQYLVDKLAK